MRISGWLLDSLKLMSRDTIEKVVDVLIIGDKGKAKQPKDDHGHFYEKQGAPCPHKHGKGGSGNNSREKRGKNENRNPASKLAEAERDYIKDPIDGHRENIREANHKFPKPDPTGSNKFKTGWNEENAMSHWTEHMDQYPELTYEQYVKKAIHLLQKPVGREKGSKIKIQGYLRTDWCVVRYDGRNFAIGNPYTGVIDMFVANQSYYDGQVNKNEW